MTKTALLLVDIQNDYFPGGAFEVTDMVQAGEKAAILLNGARDKGDCVIHIRHEKIEADAPFFAAGSFGAQIHSLVAPQNGEKVIVKHRPNSFYDTGLHDELLEQGVSKLVICGAMSQMCIDATTRAAVDLGYECVIVADACAARPLSFNGLDVPATYVHAAFMAALGAAYGRVQTAAAYLAEEIG